MTPSPSTLAIAVLAAVTFCLAPIPVSAQLTLDSEFRTNGDQMHGLVTAAKEVLKISTASIFFGRNEEVVYGMVISSDGYILTKASEIKDKKDLSARIDRKAYPLSAILVEDSAWDVALVKVEASGLTPISFAENSQVEIGSWVVSNGASTRFQRRPMLGIVSAKSREIPPEGGAVLGVQIVDNPKGLLVEDVPDKTGAKEAGLLKGDILTMLATTAIKTREDVMKFMQKCRVGQVIDVAYLRKGKKQQTKIKLAGRVDTFGRELNRNDNMSGQFSERRSGFPRVIQHDTIGDRLSAGGALLDLDGKCIGMNIARVNRCESFAIPIEELRELVKSLMKDVANRESPSQ
jgi:serine protease Do